MVLTFLILLVANIFVGTINARDGVFVIEPTKEVIENVELKIPDEVVGNVSISNGLIDFYVTNPSGIPIFCYNKTAFETFKFTAEQNGTYIMHFVNVENIENVTVTLSYSIHVILVLYGNVDLKFSVGTAHVVGSVTPTTPFDWIMFLKDYIYPLITASVSALIGALIKVLRKFQRERKWKKKYRAPRTPVVVKPF
jgi:hypothetical protein